MIRSITLASALFLSLSATASAHFQEVIPSADILSGDEARAVTVEMRFTHPMERGPLMDMKAPVQFGVQANGEKTDLRGALEKTDFGYQTTFDFAAPADYQFYIQPAPYWEPAEGKYIVHYTKVAVNYANGEGWDDLLGLPVEIQPLVRPYGLWAGNQFRGVVLKGGNPVPFAEVEVEWRNDGSVTAPSDPFVTQVVKADANGTFSYVMPRAGWWGFAALLEADQPMKSPEGQDVPVEEGALIWVKTVDMK